MMSKVTGSFLFVPVIVGAMFCAGCKTGLKPSGDTMAADQRVSEPIDQIARSTLRENAVEMLLDFFADPNPQLRANAIEALAPAPGRLIAILPDALVDSNEAVRTVGAMMVGQLAIVDLAQQVRPLLDDESPYVRAAAIYALRRCGQDVDPSPLAVMLLSEPSPRVRSHVAFILGELGDRSAVPLLREAVSVRMPRADQSQIRLMHLQFAEAMIKLGDDEQLETVRAALYVARPEDLETTALAVQIIGQAQDRGAIDHLKYLAAYKNERGQFMPAEVRLAVGASLAAMGIREGGFLADEYADSDITVLRAQAAFVYGQTAQPGALEAISKLMEDPEPLVRLAAAAAILQALGGADERPL